MAVHTSGKTTRDRTKETEVTRSTVGTPSMSGRRTVKTGTIHDPECGVGNTLLGFLMKATERMKVVLVAQDLPSSTKPRRLDHRETDAGDTYQDVRNYLRSLPTDKTTEVFGMNENASITFAQREQATLLENADYLYRKTAKSQ
ncbi:hypothetical protein BC832DRAFT_589316 [Gaertneriomyces semiglobifer]|nr:hypothetical protein BC832DRAFT_589316 [Gaertneriomyces semiglobifer]